jgi:hypothetical protein
MFIFLLRESCALQNHVHEPAWALDADSPMVKQSFFC